MNAIIERPVSKMSNCMRVLKKSCLFTLLFFGSFQAYSQTYLVAVGSDIYEVDPLSCTETFLCTISVNTGGGTITSTIEDIAYHPDGNLYGIVSNYFISIDLGLCTSNTIATHTTSANSLVAAADGTLYAASDELYTVDPISGVFTSVGTLPCQSGGDLAFEGGDLYLTCASGDLLKVDTNNPANSTVIGNLGTGYWYGLWTIYTDCGNTQVLVASEDDLYEVDMNNANTTFSCSLGTSWITGATMQGDYNASECGCGVDLGPDADLCSGPVELNAADSNYTYLWSDGSTDSTFTASIAGTYYVTITDTTDGCTSSDTITIADCELGIAEQDDSFMIFPNPSDGHFNVNLSGFQAAEIIVTDVAGRTVYRGANTADIINLDLSHLTQGSYFISLLSSDEQMIISKKIQIMK